MMRSTEKTAAVPLDRFAIARALREIGELLALKADEYFRTRAYARAADTLEDLEGDFDALVRERKLTMLPGVGDSIAALIDELYWTGRSRLLAQLEGELPPGGPAIARGTKLPLSRIQALHAALGIMNLEELEDACERGLVRQLRGFGPKTEASLLERIRSYRSHRDRVLLIQALAIGAKLVHAVGAHPSAIQVELAGSARRLKETVSGIALVASSKQPEAMIARLKRFGQVAEVEQHTKRRITVRLSDGLKVSLRAVPPSRFGTALHRATGSRAHRRAICELARSRGVSLRGAPTEEDLYGRLGLALIPPELRENRGEVEAAADGRLPTDLVRVEDVRGLVHCHTVFSDGRNTIEQMAVAAEAMGARYLTITDHSQSAGYAGGLSVDRLKAQWDEIARVQERVRVKLLRGTESDILADGALDYPDAVLEQLDIVIASVHGRLRMDEDQMTRRLLGAMRSPVFKVWGHPLGRLLLERAPLKCRLEDVLDAVAVSRAAVEINGDPRRLDLPAESIGAARVRGIRFVISTDAHSIAELGNGRYAVGNARRGWVTRSEVLNTLELEAFVDAVRPAT